MGAPKDIFFSDVVFQGDDGYIVDWGGMILKSSDAGRSWQQATLVGRAMYAVAAPEPGRAFAAGGEGTTVATGDGGKSWQPQRCCKTKRSTISLSLTEAVVMLSEPPWLKKVAPPDRGGASLPRLTGGLIGKSTPTTKRAY